MVTCIVDRWYFLNREEVDAKVEARLAKELAAKKAKEEEER